MTRPNPFSVLLLCGGLLCLAAARVPAATVYVSLAGNDTDGSSWTNAYRTVAGGLAAASAATNDELWIAGGVYAETASLNSKAGVPVYGGFSGTEPAGYDKSLRDFITNATTITVIGSRVVNVNAAGDHRWDGLSIVGGRVTTGVGAGLWAQDGNLTLSECVFYDNVVNATANNNGGGAVYLSANVDAVTIDGCEFLKNSVSVSGTPSNTGGGALYVANAASLTLTLRNCHFAENSVGVTAAGPDIYGGACMILKQATVESCQFISNSVTLPSATGNARGGAINCGTLTAITLSRCSFINNIASGGSTNSVGGAFAATQNNFVGTFENCYFSGNYQSSGRGHAIGMTFYGEKKIVCRHCTFDGRTVIPTTTGYTIRLGQAGSTNPAPNTASEFYNCAFLNYQPLQAAIRFEGDATRGDLYPIMDYTLWDNTNSAERFSDGSPDVDAVTTHDIYNASFALTAGDPHLPAGSPAIDAAPALSPALGDIDVPGGDPATRPHVSGNDQDCGCDEWDWSSAPRVNAAIGNPQAQSLEVTFSEAMGGGVLNPLNYVLSGAGRGTVNPNPDSVALVSGNTYQLTWNTGAMANGLPITVTVNSNVTDLFGNAIDSAHDQASGTAVPVTLSGIRIE